MYFLFETFVEESNRFNNYYKGIEIFCIQAKRERTYDSSNCGCL